MITAAGSNGLYQLGGDDDAGVDGKRISPVVCWIFWWAYMMSRTPRMYFDFSGDSGLAVSRVYFPRRTSPDGSVYSLIAAAPG